MFEPLNGNIELYAQFRLADYLTKLSERVNFPFEVDDQLFDVHHDMERGLDDAVRALIEIDYGRDHARSYHRENED